MEHGFLENTLTWRSIAVLILQSVVLNLHLSVFNDPMHVKPLSSTQPLQTTPLMEYLSEIYDTT